jgi:putative tryptophan/tyrosine transport system substrate-binding protein
MIEVRAGPFARIGAVIGTEAAALRNAPEIERTVAAFARSPNGGLIVASSGLAIIHRNVIVTPAARHKLPAVYFERFFVAAGALISYGTDTIDPFRRAAGYIDRILMGEKHSALQYWLRSCERGASR